MKLLIPLLLLSLQSTNAFARHAYRSEECTSTTHNLSYKGNYPIGGLYGFSVKGEEEVSAYPLYDSETASTLDDAEVIFEDKSWAETSERVPTVDCDFDHEEWTSEKVIEISLITTDASKTLGLKKGDQIHFTCVETTDYPNANSCEDN